MKMNSRYPLPSVGKIADFYRFFHTSAEFRGTFWFLRPSDPSKALGWDKTMERVAANEYQKGIFERRLSLKSGRCKYEYRLDLSKNQDWRIEAFKENWDSVIGTLGDPCPYCRERGNHIIRVKIIRFVLRNKLTQKKVRIFYKNGFLKRVEPLG